MFDQDEIVDWGCIEQIVSLNCLVKIYISSNKINAKNMFVIKIRSGKSVFRLNNTFIVSENVFYSIY